MSVSGNWVLHYSWGSTGTYSQVNITFNNNGTFSGALSGKWVQQDGTILWKYDSGPAKYTGTINGNIGSGATSTFSGSNGCWYLTKQGTVGIVAAIEAAGGVPQTHDVAGNMV